MISRSLVFVSLGSAALTFTACSDKKSNQGYRVTTELLRMEGGTYLRAATKPALLLAADPDRYAWTSNIDIKSLKLPIRTISLSAQTGDSSTSNSQTLYSCDVDCEVDLLGPALTNLLEGKVAEIKVAGTFQKISVSFGEGTTEWTGKITAEFELGGQKYYTKAGGSPSTTAPAEESSYKGFGGGSESYLPEPLVLTEQNGEDASAAKPLTVKLYFDALYAANAIDGSKVEASSYASSFCVGDINEDVVRICTQRLVVSASTQDAAPTLERYMINEASLATLYFDNNSSPLGGSLRNVLREGYPNRGTVGDVDLTQAGTNSADTKDWSSGPIFNFTKNADATFNVATTIGEPSASNENGGFRARAFKRETHSGQYETSQGNKYDYAAIKL